MRDEFVAESEAMLHFMTKVERAARHGGSVLVMGETGTGKERIARTLHDQSLRSARPFIEINCAALPEHLVESELFGFEKGAFSGADAAKPGLFELADTGSIFLDEIGELDAKTQVKLLRVLDRSPYFRLGGQRKVVVDVRVIAATNRNLLDEVQAGRFRKDLYYRLSQLELHVPALRERPLDIVVLAERFLEQEEASSYFSSEALNVLQTYEWPGNVRELKGLVSKLSFACSGPSISAADVLRELERRTWSSEVGTISASPTVNNTKKAEDDLRRALDRSRGHRGQAAADLGISRRTLSRKLKDYGVPSLRTDDAPPTHLSPENERIQFRARLTVPANLLTQAGELVPCHTANLSATGVALEGVALAADLKSQLRVRFNLPETNIPVDVNVRLAWRDRHGNIGLNFMQINSATRAALRVWLGRRMRAEDNIAAECVIS